MKVATKGLLAAMLTVCLAGAALPVVAWADELEDNVASSASSYVDDDGTIVVTDSYEWINYVDKTETNGKWYRFLHGDEDELDYKTLRYMVKINQDGNIDFYVDGEGRAGSCLYSPAWASEYADQHGRNGTTYIGAGITSVGTSELGSAFNWHAENVRFAKDSQLTYIGAHAFANDIRSANLQACKKLKKLGAWAFGGATCKLTIPTSVRHISLGALEGVNRFELLDPKNTPIKPAAWCGTSNELGSIFPGVKAKASGNGKLKVSWSAPQHYVYSPSKGKTVLKKYTGKVYYRASCRISGRVYEQYGPYTTGKSTTLSGLLKGRNYTVTVSAYKKTSSGSYKLLTSDDAKATVK